jgi:cation-transporting ATPase E
MTGLSEAEVRQRRGHGLSNTAPPRIGRTYRQIVVENVFTFINICLFGLGVALVLARRA